MEFGEMKRNTSNWSNFCMLLRRAGLTASAGLSCQHYVPCDDLPWLHIFAQCLHTQTAVALSLALAKLSCFRRPHIPETKHWTSFRIVSSSLTYLFACWKNMLMRLTQFQCFIPVLFNFRMCERLKQNWNKLFYCIFCTLDAMLARVIAIVTCLSVCLSVCPSVCHELVLCQNEES